MTALSHIAVIDIGKTNAKLALVDLVTLTEIAVVTRPNKILAGPPWPHFDVEGHWQFLLAALAQFHRDHRIDAISITTHGACVALLAEDGSLAAPILDYEHAGPSDDNAPYDDIRPSFAQTGSPRLAGGLNVGAQLHWQFKADPTLRDRTAHIVTYPQYWGHRLTGVAACDVTSIGCHTDLWSPQVGTLSSLVNDLDIAEKLAPVRRPTEILGTILPEVASRTGLPVSTPVSVGIHDSNASLYPHILMQKEPFSVVSTGTWVIAMSVGGANLDLDMDRDTLINVNARGEPVRSARFMGGREYEIVLDGQAVAASDEDIEQALSKQLMLLPAVEPNTGPFQGRVMTWVGEAPAVGTGLRTVVLSLYLALMTGTCLRLSGAYGPVIVEGPFARNTVFLTMLAAATGRDILRCKSATGTSIGAALLFGSGDELEHPELFNSTSSNRSWEAYAACWQLKSVKGRSH